MTDKKFTEIEKEIAAINFDILFDELFKKTDIRFVGSNLYQPYDGWGIISEEEANSLFTVLKIKGKQKMTELIVEGNELIIELLKKIPSEYAWGLSFDDATKYLDENKISWEVIFEEEAPTV